MKLKPLSCEYGCFTIPQRYVLTIMLHLALLNAYHLRVVLNVAITEMTEPKNDTNIVDACPQYTYEQLDVKGGRYEWPNWIEAFVLYAFYIGYIFGQLPGGWLADKIGARHVLGACMVSSICITMVFPIAIQAGGYKAAIILRGFLGFAQGPLYPSISAFIQSWVPGRERGFLGGFAYGGANLGSFTGSLFTGLIVKKTNSWPMAFYIWGVVALLWYIFYFFMVFSHPSTHPFITQEEFDFLKDELEEKVQFKIPWLKIVTCAPVWAILASQFCHNYIYFTIGTDLPKYMKDILKFNIQANGLYSALPFLAVWVSGSLFSFLADFMTNTECLSVIYVRKLYTAFASLAPAACIVLATYLGCDRTSAIVLYTFGLSLIGSFYSGTEVNINDISHHYGGTIMALVNALGSASGIIGPMIGRLLTPNNSLEEWHSVFWIMFGITVFTTTIFIIFASSERQEWDYPHNN